MKSSPSLKNLAVSPFDIVLFHIGGCGDYGPIESVLRRFPRRSVVVLFEARESTDDITLQRVKNDKGIRTFLINRCISDINGQQHFYVNKHVASSGIFSPAPKAMPEHYPMGSNVKTWAENTELDFEMDVPAITLDSFVDCTPDLAPDILSSDAQGAELKIFRGGQNLLAHNISAIVSEVEFVEIYEGQCLFHEQFEYLQRMGFRLADILNQQFWHPDCIAGTGFFTVGEALFFRNAASFCNDPSLSRQTKILKLIKLAAIAICFNRISFSYSVLNTLLKDYEEAAQTAILESHDFAFLLDIHTHIRNNLQAYEADCRFFKTDPVLKRLVGKSDPGSEDLAQWSSLHPLARASHTFLTNPGLFFKKLGKKLRQTISPS